METQSALDILREYDTRCRKHAGDLPSPVEIKEEWLGVGFRMGGKNFVTSLVEVAEILYFPSISKVPGTKPWVCGVANVRGNLLPVLDLQGFLGAPSHLERHSRVLVVNHENVYSGLLVDEVLGLKHFLQESHQKRISEFEDSIKPFLQGTFETQEGEWSVFSMHKLAESPQFLHVAY